MYMKHAIFVCEIFVLMFQNELPWFDSYHIKVVVNVSSIYPSQLHQRVKIAREKKYRSKMYTFYIKRTKLTLTQEER